MAVHAHLKRAIRPVLSGSNGLGARVSPAITLEIDEGKAEIVGDVTKTHGCEKLGQAVVLKYKVRSIIVNTSACDKCDWDAPGPWGIVSRPGSGIS